MVVFCWRELVLRLGGICLLLGLVLGASPLMIYNLNAPPGQDSLSILLALQHAEPQARSSHLHGLMLLAQQIKGTLLYSIPIATGNPFCPALTAQGTRNAPTLLCTIIRGGWGLGFTVL